MHDITAVPHLREKAPSLPRIWAIWNIPDERSFVAINSNNINHHDMFTPAPPQKNEEAPNCLTANTA